MKTEHETLCVEFMAYEKTRGIQNIPKIVTELKPYFHYLDVEGLRPEEMGVKEAEEYQTYLSALTARNGAIYYAAESVSHMVGRARRLYDYLTRRGRVYANPFLRIKRVKVERKLPHDIPAEAVLDAMLAELGRFWERDTLLERRMYYKTHVAAELMYATGLRISEILDLRPSDIDFERKIVSVRKGKGGRARKAYLNDYAASVLRLFLNEMRDLVIVNLDSDRLFGIKNKSTVTATFHRLFGRAASRVGVKRFTTHAFRHSLGFHLLRRGCDLRYIQLILGHENMNSTVIYTKVEKTDLRSVLDRCHPRTFKRQVKQPS